MRTRLIVLAAIGVLLLAFLPATSQGDDLIPRAFLPLVIRNYPPQAVDLGGCEPNESFFSACVIPGPGVYRERLAAWDEDWYAYTSPSGGVTITMDVPEGYDFDLYLYDVHGNLLTYSIQSGSADEEVSWSAGGQTGYVFVAIPIVAPEEGEYVMEVR